MKKKSTLKAFAFFLCAFLSSASFAQSSSSEAAPKANQQEITFSKQSEKDARIKQMEDKLKIDLTDPSYPVADIEKQKKELAEIKKAKVIAGKK